MHMLTDNSSFSSNPNLWLWHTHTQRDVTDVWADGYKSSKFFYFFFKAQSSQSRCNSLKQNQFDKIGILLVNFCYQKVVSVNQNVISARQKVISVSLRGLVQSQPSYTCKPTKRLCCSKHIKWVYIYIKEQQVNTETNY